MATIAEVLQLAWQRHQAGDFQQADRLYRQILQADRTCADAWCFLGALSDAQGKAAEAIPYYRQAIQLQPSYVAAHYNLGLALEHNKQPNAAAESYRQALKIEPGLAEAHLNLGNVLSNLGELNQAISHWQEALRLRPDFAEIRESLGSALLRQGKPKEAVACFDEALRQFPKKAEVHNSRGLALERLGQLEEALQSYNSALQLRPNVAETWNNLGNVLFMQQKQEEARAHYLQALRLMPDYPEAHCNLAIAFQSASKVEEAAEHCRAALKLKPDFAAAHQNLAGALLEHGEAHLAVASYREALRIEPNLETAQSNLLFCLNHDPEANPDEVFEEHRRWGEARGKESGVRGQEDKAAENFTAGQHTNDPDPERMLRIGYVSPDLKQHALTRYFEPVLASHDLKVIQSYCYAEIKNGDTVTKRLQNAAHGWRSTCRLTDDQVAEQIRKDRIDILVDLAGHTANSRLRVFIQKPAPVQATWLGYLNTTGLADIDYRLTDELFDPPGKPHRDCEELYRLPEGMCCFAPPLNAPAVTRLPALKKGYFTFGSLHGMLKLNAHVLNLWSKVLAAVPTARLIMFHHSLTGRTQEYVRRQLAERGLADERIDIREGSASEGYLGVFSEIDVSLDTFPWSGGVTACESLWMGVPVLSVRGERPAGRHSAALLTRVGLADWAADSADQYVARAVTAAADLSRLAELRLGLRESVTRNLCDAKRFTRGLEDAYRTMWRRWCAKRV